MPHPRRVMRSQWRCPGRVEAEPCERGVDDDGTHEGVAKENAAWCVRTTRGGSWVVKSEMMKDSGYAGSERA
jgi:hypothetical protein